MGFFLQNGRNIDAAIIIVHFRKASGLAGNKTQALKRATTQRFFRLKTPAICRFQYTSTT